MEISDDLFLKAVRAGMPADTEPSASLYVSHDRYIYYSGFDLRAALEAVAPAIRAAAMEEAVQIAIDLGCAEEVTSAEHRVAQRAAHRLDMAFEVASALETKAAAIRAAKETK